MHQRLWWAMSLALAVAGGGCHRARQESPDPPITRRTPPACHIDASLACRVGCDADLANKVVNVAPDLSGLEVTGVNGFEVVEILIGDRGDVQQVCLLRGVREDIDGRAIAAIRQWRFEPARRRHSTPPGLPVPSVTTVTLQIGAPATGVGGRRRSPHASAVL